MKRIALLLVCGALVASAQDVRISHAALLKSERVIVSLRAGTIVDVLSRDEWTLTVRFNNHTGLIPASSLAPGALSSQTKNFGVSVRNSGSPHVDAVNKIQENGTNSGGNNAKTAAAILAVN